MSRKSEALYLEFGQTLAGLRAQRFPSALAFYKSVASDTNTEPKTASVPHAAKSTSPEKFEFSYSKYADFERGMVLPSLAEALQLAKYFQYSEESMAYLWAKVQMPAHLRDSFDPRYIHSEKPLPPSPKTADEIRHNLDTTWVFGPAERKLLEKHPAFIDLILMLTTNAQKSVSLQQTGLSLADIKPLLDLERVNLEQTASGPALSLKYPFFYIPKTPEWQGVRFQNMRRALERTMALVTPEQINEQSAVHSMVTTRVSKAVVKELVEQIKNIESTLIRNNPRPDDEVYSFVSVLAPRKLDPSQK